MKANHTDSTKPDSITSRDINADELAMLENDAVWNLIDDAAHTPAGPLENPMFARNVMREIRLLKDNRNSTAPWYKRLISGSFAKWALPATALSAAAACILAFTDFSGTPTQTTTPTLAVESHSTADLTSLEEEIYIYHDADPVFISEEEIASIFEM